MARILVTKLGLDGHDVGAKVLTVGLRDAGHEVVWLGIRPKIDAVIAAAMDEDVDLIAISMLSGSHCVLVPELLRRLREESCFAPVVVGGLIPESDKAELLAGGVSAVVNGGATTTQAIAAIHDVLTAGRDTG